MKRKLATLVRTARMRPIMFTLLAALGGLAIAAAVHAQSTTTSEIKMVRGYQATTSVSSVLLMTIPNGLGKVEVDCSGGLSRIAFYPSVSGSLWWINGGSTGYANGTAGSQLSNQSTADLITAQFATTTQTATMVISGNPGATCIYAGQAIVQP
jgi:hypothetical protein